MANDTTITVIGNLTGDPELRFTPTGQPVANFSVASTPRRYDTHTGQWVDSETLFLRCAAWRDLGENIAESLHKGQRVIVTGRLRANTWQTPDGDNRTSLEVDVDEAGPSLRWAQAKVAKVRRDQPTTAALADPWTASSSPTTTAPPPSTATPAAATGTAGQAATTGPGAAPVPAGAPTPDEPPF